MEKYQRMKEIGRGAYGVVWQALNKQNGEVVAIKKLNRKYSSLDDCLNLMEVKSLRTMNHPNIIKLIEIVNEKNTLFMVFEFMQCSLYQRMTDRTKPRFSESDIRNMCFQIFQGLAHMHNNGYFHRDIKPENLLVSNDVIKIADLGQARETNGKPPYTSYVTTRWYRAPEVLLYSNVYDSAVDMWAMGAIMAELFTLQPLFPGDTAIQVMHRICSVIGSPTRTTWLTGRYLADSICYQFPELPGVDLSEVIPTASADALNLISALLSWDPRVRPTAMEALDHPFFYGCYPFPRTCRCLPLVFKVPEILGWPKKSRSLQRRATSPETEYMMSLLPEGLLDD